MVFVIQIEITEFWGDIMKVLSYVFVLLVSLAFSSTTVLADAAGHGKAKGHAAEAASDAAAQAKDCGDGKGHGCSKDQPAKAASDAAHGHSTDGHNKPHGH